MTNYEMLELTWDDGTKMSKKDVAHKLISNCNVCPCRGYCLSRDGNCNKLVIEWLERVY